MEMRDYNGKNKYQWMGELVTIGDCYRVEAFSEHIRVTCDVHCAANRAGTDTSDSLRSPGLHFTPVLLSMTVLKK